MKVYLKKKIYLKFIKQIMNQKPNYFYCFVNAFGPHRYFLCKFTPDRDVNIFVQYVQANVRPHSNFW